MKKTLLDSLVAQFSSLETMPVWRQWHAERLCKLLDSANDEALLLLYHRRVKFVWMLARRRLQERGHDL